MKVLNETEYKEIIERNTGKVVIDFYADWCGPCQMIAPLVEKLAEEYTDIEFYKVNVDDNQELAIKNNIMSIPTICFLKDGKEINRVVGFIAKQEFKEYLEKM